MQKTVLLTGGTGSLGKFIVEFLLESESVKLILLVRASSNQEAINRVNYLISKYPNRIEVYASDLEKPNLGLSEDDYKHLSDSVTSILHSAASTKFTLPIDVARVSNVETVKNMVEFAKKCSKLERFGHLSTALVSGKRIGHILEEEFEHDEGFNNTYQQSKYEAEKILRNNLDNLPIVIFRPPLVYSTPDKESGPSFSTFLSLLITLVVGGKLPYVPGTENSEMEIVSGIDTARIITKLFLKDELSHFCYQITNNSNKLTVKLFHQMMEEESGKKIPIEYCGNGDAGLETLHKKIKGNPEMEAIYKKAESFLSEPGYPKVFSNLNTLNELGIDKIGKDPIEILRSAVQEAIWNFSK